MNSCRNCQHATHDLSRSAFNPELYCTRTKRTVAAPMSMNTRENLAADDRLRTIALTCAEYQREE